MVTMQRTHPTFTTQVAATELHILAQNRSRQDNINPRPHPQPQAEARRYILAQASASAIIHYSYHAAQTMCCTSPEYARAQCMYACMHMHARNCKHGCTHTNAHSGAGDELEEAGRVTTRRAPRPTVRAVLGGTRVPFPDPLHACPYLGPKNTPQSFASGIQQPDA
jgi:hypothetical protein